MAKPNRKGGVNGGAGVVPQSYEMVPVAALQPNGFNVNQGAAARAHWGDGVFIYALSDPRTGKIRYVGKTTDPKGRLQGHVSKSYQRFSTDHKTCWIRGLRLEGLRPELHILDYVPRAAWQWHEVYWIGMLRLAGIDLINMTPGGDAGGSLSAEARIKIGLSGLGRKPWNKGTRGVMRAWNKGISSGPHTRDKLSCDWEVTDPHGNLATIRNLKNFCRENGLKDALMNKVAHGARRHHRGWTCRRLTTQCGK